MHALTLCFTVSPNTVICASGLLMLVVVLQLFLHKIFGYRGIVLFPWLARVYDRDVATKTEERSANGFGRERERERVCVCV